MYVYAFIGEFAHRNRLERIPFAFIEWTKSPRCPFYNLPQDVAYDIWLGRYQCYLESRNPAGMA